MISTKKLIKMAKKWQKIAAAQRKRIVFPKDVEHVNEDTLFASSTPTTSSSKTDSGCFVVYSADQQRFRIPLHYLNNEIFKELLKMSEEEFGLPSEGAIILPVDGKLLDYIIAMIQRGLAGDIQRALLESIAITRCSLPYGLAPFGCIASSHECYVSDQLSSCGSWSCSNQPPSKTNHH